MGWRRYNRLSFKAVRLLVSLTSARKESGTSWKIVSGTGERRFVCHTFSCHALINEKLQPTSQGLLSSCSFSC